MKTHHHRLSFVALLLALIPLLLFEGCLCALCEDGEVTIFDFDGSVIDVVTYESCSAAQAELRDFQFIVLSYYGSSGAGKTNTDPSTTIKHLGRLRGPIGSQVHAVAADGMGNFYAGGTFTEGYVPDWREVSAPNIIMWDGAGREGQGEWRNLGNGLNGAVQALAISPEGHLYAGGSFTSPNGSELPLNRIGRWNDVARQWEMIGQGARGGFSPHIQAMAFDAAGRLIVAGEFTEVLDGQGQITMAYGIARWDPEDGSWTTFGEGFGVRQFNGILPGEGEEIIVSGQITPLGQELSHAMMRWDGAAWSPYTDGLEAQFGAFEVTRDAAGQQFVRHYYYDDADHENTGFRIAQRGPDDAAWETIAHQPNIRGIAAHNALPGIYTRGTFTEMDNLPANGHAHWTGQSWQPAALPGTCSNLQLINAIPDPNMMPFNLMLDGEFVAPELGFGQASPALSMETGRPYQARVVLDDEGTGKWLRHALIGANADTLFAVDDLVFDDRTCVGAAVGVSTPWEYAPNPDGMDTKLGYAMAEVSASASKNPNVAPFLILHAVPDAPALDVRLDGNLLAENITFGEFSNLLTLAPNRYTLDLVQHSDGAILSTFNVNLNLTGELQTITLNGFLDPDSNNGGPTFTIQHVVPSGEALPVSAEIESRPTGSPTLALHGHYPNPVATRTTIDFSLTHPGPIRLVVYDLLGRVVDTLVDDHRNAGRHSVEFDARRLSAGTYIYQIQAGSQTDTRMLQRTH